MTKFNYKNMLFIALLFFLAISSCIYNNIPDYNLWMDLISGSYFLQNAEILKQDYFSYMPTIEWFNQNWGAGTIFYALAKLDLGTYFFRVLILFLTLFTIKKTIDLNKEVEFQHSGFLYYVFCFSTLALTILNAQIFSIFFFALWVYILEKTKKDNYDLLWLIPFTSIIWVNTHNSGILGLGLLLIYIVTGIYDEIKYKNNSLIKTLKTKRASSLLGSFGFSVFLMTFLNPYLWWTWTKSLSLLFISRIENPAMQPFYNITDFWIIGNIQIPMVIGYLLFVILTVAILSIKHINKEKIDTTRFVLLFISLISSMLYKVYAGYFLILSLGFLYPEFYFAFKTFKNNCLKMVSKDNKGPLKGVFAFFNIALIATFIIYAFNGPMDNNLPMKLNSIVYPVKAVKFIKANFMEGNIAAPSYWGGYLAWELYPDNKISIDTRGRNVYSQEVYNNGLELEYNGYYFQNLFYKYPTDIVILNRRTFPESELNRFARNWQYVYADEISIVLVKQNQYKGVYVTPEFTPDILKLDLTKNFSI